MEYKELKKKSEADLHKIIAESRDKLRELRFKDANKQLKDVRAIRKIRKIIAQALMLLKKQQKIDKTEDVNKDNKGSDKEK